MLSFPLRYSSPVPERQGRPESISMAELALFSRRGYINVFTYYARFTEMHSEVLMSCFFRGVEQEAPVKGGSLTLRSVLNSIYVFHICLSKIPELPHV